MGSRFSLLAVTCVAVAVVAPSSARADIANFDLSGKIYNKLMSQNDDTKGCLSMSNPFWVDNIGGHNGVCSEFEMYVRGRLGSRVSAQVRLQSRWGALWQDWWENGDNRGVEDTSGEAQGMNHAAYIKLRGATIRFAPPLPAVRWITVGSTDLSMWNEWTIGKARYIDRDNGAGIFFEGDLLSNKRLSYTTGAMALPKLWAGPGWNTGLKENEPLASLWGTDWAYAFKLESQTTNDLRLRAVGSVTQDWEADRYDADRTGTPSVDRGADHAVNLVTRFRGANATLDGAYSPSALEMLSVSGLLAYSNNWVNPDYATNLVTNGQGFSPVVFRKTADGKPDVSSGYAVKGLVELFDPFKVGLSMKAEYFNIGAEYNAIMGSRREADVLLTDGIITGGFTGGGQLPTLNIANEFVDFNEPWFESCIGWHGGTLLLEQQTQRLRVSLEGTFITYNTNMQGRDVKAQYPDFLYTHGFTETAAYTSDSDYANVNDRGKDPRSVYTEYQDRQTGLAVLNVEYLVPALKGVVINAKGKVALDQDNRKLDNPDDDYRGTMLLGFASVGWQATNELKVTAGYEYQRFVEPRRTGTQQSGFFDDATTKNTARLGMTYAFGGVLVGYVLEYFHKNLDRGRPGSFDMAWNVWRSKGTLEVAF